MGNSRLWGQQHVQEGALMRDGWKTTLFVPGKMQAGNGPVCAVTGASRAALNPASSCAGVTFLELGCKAALTAGTQPGSQGSATPGQGLVPVCGLLGTGPHSRRLVVGD